MAAEALAMENSDHSGAEKSAWRLVETTVSHYRIIQKLGGGGMGVVYKAEDTSLGRSVALKFLPDEFSHDPQKLERFRREAWAASSLNHPNICTIYEIGEHEGRMFIAMELVEGNTLAEKLKGGPLPIEEAADISRQIGEALEEAHEHNIVHRDLKPANVMITPKGRVKILDFGLAKLVRPVEHDAPTREISLQTQAGTVMGTVPYMAPEQLRGESVDARADLYALGGVLYEMTTGQRPFPETQTNRLIADILTTSPRPPHELNPQVTADLETVVLKALSRDRSERYQSAQEFLTDLGAPGTVTRRAFSVAQEAALRPAPSRRPWMIALVAGIGITILAGLVVFLVPAVRRHFITAPSASQGLPNKKQLAVLPFSVIAGNPGDNAFSRGLAETLAAKLTELSPGHSLQVVPVADVTAQHVTTAKEAQKAFGANLVLTGSLERAGNQVRISYALVNPSTDLQISAKTLTLSASDPFGIEDQVIEGTAGMLDLTVRTAERQKVESHGTQVASAF
ncbi:MAG: protein kinase, partial [Acidobacteriota bacterium]